MPVKRPSGKAPSPRNSLAVCSTPSADMRHLLRTELVGRIHDRMPAILRPEDYSRWLALDPDGPNLLQPFPSEPLIIWPISTRVNSPKNDGADLLEPLADAGACWPPEGNSAWPYRWSVLDWTLDVFGGR